MQAWMLGLAGLLVGAALGAAVVAAGMLARRARHREELASTRASAAALEERLEAGAREVETLRADKDAAHARREAAECRAAASAERIRALEEAEERLKQAFRATGAEALEANTRQFLALARKTFEGFMGEARGDVEQRRQAIEHLVKPIHALLERQQAAVGEIERRRETAYVALEEQIKAIAASHGELRTQTGRLVTALRRPEQRGRWGELQLRNAVELAGMTAHCDFREQAPTDDPDTRDRPDMVVRLPGGGSIVVDAKVALDRYLDALEREEERAPLLRAHADLIDRHYKALSNRRYWDQFEHTPRLVVMFMPLESALVAALEIKPDLHAQAMRRHVLIATPTLLVALLRAVAYGWQQESIAENAREIAKAGSELFDRVRTFTEHFRDLGRRLGSATGAYNSAVASLETRVLPTTRRLRELEVTSRPEIESAEPIQVEVRPLIPEPAEPVTRVER